MASGCARLGVAHRLYEQVSGCCRCKLAARGPRQRVHGRAGHSSICCAGTPMRRARHVVNGRRQKVVAQAQYVHTWSKLRAASRRVEWTVPRAQECPSCAACCRHTARRWVLCMPSDRCVLVCHVRRDPTFSMAARKKVLLKVIILGDSGYVDSAVRGCTKPWDSRHLCCSGACMHGGAGAVAERSRAPVSAQHSRAVCYVNALSPFV
ncbi:MAG: hypothetical protein ACPIOQ_34120 [Promethearchaeia archaeon]